MRVSSNKYSTAGYGEERSEGERFQHLYDNDPWRRRTETWQYLWMAAYMAQAAASSVFLAVGVVDMSEDTWFLALDLAGRTRFRFAYPLEVIVPILFGFSAVRHARKVTLKNVVVDRSINDGIVSMFVITSSGVEDLGMILTVFALNGVQQVIEVWHDSDNASAVRVARSISWIAFACKWVLLLYYFVAAAVTAEGDGLKGVNGSMSLTVLLLYFLFGLMRQTGNVKNTRTAFLLDCFTFVMRSTLAWLWLFGVTRE